MTKKRWALTCAGGLIVVILLLGFLGFGTQIRAIRTIRKLGDNLFYMEYVGDYGLTQFLEQGGARSDDEVGAYLTKFFSRGLYKFEAPEKIYGCSTIAAEGSGGGYLFGRNFDWNECTALIIKTVPTDGYVSISTANTEFLGVSGDPQNIGDKFAYLGSTYIPLDGMNEKGLCVAVLALPESGRACQDTGKAGITTTTAIRMLLDQAATVDEALELLNQYDMYSSAELGYHFALADASGKAVVVEYLDNRMYVTEEAAATNHILTPGPYYEIGKDEWSAQRYETLVGLLKQSGGTMDADQVKEALSRVSSYTQWSIVFDQKDLEVIYYYRMDYENAFYFNLSEVDGGPRSKKN